MYDFQAHSGLHVIISSFMNELWHKKHPMKVAESYDPMNHTVHGILQARKLEWVAVPFSRGSSQLRDQTGVFCIAGGFFTNWATREAPVGRSLVADLQLTQITSIQSDSLVRNKSHGYCNCEEGWELWSSSLLRQSLPHYSTLEFGVYLCSLSLNSSVFYFNHLRVCEFHCKLSKNAE